MERRKKNPNAGWIAGGLLLAGVAALAGYYYAKSSEPKAKSKANGTTKNGEEKGGTTPPGTPDIRINYGLSIKNGCTDFIMRDPPAGYAGKVPQVEMLQAAVDAAIESGENMDPFAMADYLLAKITGDKCTWPPATNGPPRIVHMYLYMTQVLGLSVAMGGGTVLGVGPDENGEPQLPDLEAAIAMEAASRGYPAIDGSIIPELIPPKEPPPFGNTLEGDNVPESVPAKPGPKPFIAV